MVNSGAIMGKCRNSTLAAVGPFEVLVIPDLSLVQLARPVRLGG